MNVALLVLRVVVGALFVGHGCQKLCGWFGGRGLKGTASFFESVGLSPGLPLAVLAGLSELAGGLLLGFGLFVPVAALLLTGVMTTAIVAVHWRNGVWNQDGGFEFPLVLDCGQIPDSKKPIHVTGSDPYQLDGDGDGLGCE